RNLCRLAFGLLVAVPTCAVVVVVIWCRSPWSAAHYRHELAEQLALDVRLDAIGFPRPGVTRYLGLSLVDPETARTLAELTAVEVRAERQKTWIECREAEVLDGSRLDLVVEWATRWLRGRAGSESAAEIHLAKLSLHLDGGDDLLLVDVRGRFAGTQAKQPSENPREPQAVLEFSLAGQEDATPARISFDRHVGKRSAGGHGATTAIKLETGPTALPARLVELCCPGWRTWGEESTFAGNLQWQRGAAGITGEVDGRIAGIDLGKLVSTRSQHRLTGTAEVYLDEAQFRDGRLVSATGSIVAGPGLVGRSLLAAAARDLHFAENNPAAPLIDLVDYEKLALSFKISERGVSVHGKCPGSPGAVFLGRQQHRLLAEPPKGFYPLLGIVRLSALGEAVPADPAAQALLGVLPVPVADEGGFGTVPQAEREKPQRR
ncbi:MAG TPA: hypothetical protein VMF30_03255, partial [Pirellulales bacterium]|nr:hypothetical protein [Pirellulales bacterium]